jgi:cytochrome c-type biogenesis protein CcmH/NrfG
MADERPEQQGKFRERVEEEAGGLVRDDERRRRPSTQGLAFEPLADTAAASAGFIPIADRLVLESGGDGEDSAGLLPDFGMGLLLAQQKSEKCRQLLENVQSMISNGQWREALAVADEAVAADPSSGEAWALKGRCLTELGHFEPGVRVLRRARGLVSDGGLRVMVLRLESICISAITRRLEAELERLAKAGEIERALELVRDGLRQQPSSVVLLLHLANLYWMSGDRESAERAVIEARRHVGRENVDLIAELERRFTFGSLKSEVEAARLMLRQHNPKAALEHLDACRNLEGNEHYDGLREYAGQKRGSLTRLLVGGAPAVPQGALRQQTLRWLLSEELKEAEDAVRSGDFRRARGAYAAAAEIEPDCGAIYCGHARAILAQRGRRGKDELALFEELLQRSLIDPGLEDQVRSLRRSAKEARGSRR